MSTQELLLPAEAASAHMEMHEHISHAEAVQNLGQEVVGAIEHEQTAQDLGHEAYRGVKRADAIRDLGNTITQAVAERAAADAHKVWVEAGDESGRVKTNINASIMGDKADKSDKARLFVSTASETADPA